MLNIEIFKKKNWNKFDIDNIYYSSAEPIKPIWLKKIKGYIESKYNVRLMTLTYDEKIETVHIIFYDFTDLLSFCKQCNINFWQDPIELNNKAIEISGKSTIRCRICPSSFVPTARDNILASAAKHFECQSLGNLLDIKPIMFFWYNYFTIIFEKKEQAVEFLKSVYRQQMQKQIFEIARGIDKYRVVKETDILVFADYLDHYNQMEGHYKQWLEELQLSEINKYESSLTSI